MMLADGLPYLVPLQIEHAVDAIRFGDRLNTSEFVTPLFNEVREPAQLRHRIREVMPVRVDEVDDDAVLSLREEHEVGAQRLPIS